MKEGPGGGKERRNRDIRGEGCPVRKKRNEQEITSGIRSSL